MLESAFRRLVTYRADVVGGVVDVWRHDLDPEASDASKQARLVPAAARDATAIVEAVPHGEAVVGATRADLEAALAALLAGQSIPGDVLNRLRGDR